MEQTNGLDTAAHFADTTNLRSTSRSTDGTDSTDGANSDNVTGSTGSTPAHHSITNLNMALSQHTIDSSTTTNPFPQFNQADLLNFHQNSLLPHHMFSQFGRYPQFEQKPDVGVLQQQMQMREAKPYKCTQCVKAFANSSYLAQHMRIHLGIKPFGPCNYCGKKFTQLSHLQQHIRTHTGEKPYKCKFTGCDKAFSQLSNLQSHSRCHQTDKPFKCNSCYKCFTDEQSLLDHIPKHKESKHLKRLKIHICPFCGKSYTQQTYLQKHMTKHADRSKNASFGGNEVPPDPFDQQSLLAWNPIQGMGESAHDSGSFNITSLADQLAPNTMINSQYSNSSFPGSAFSNLFNFRNNRYLSEYPSSTKNAERTPGFNMITPLENIQRYNGASSATAIATATGSAVVPPTPSSATSASSTALSAGGFDPQSIINNMKSHSTY
uniref:C2H2-type domain-containing protein n=1 Tax=Caenorhabditis japonica TaxID=281687 RepID=A0A8R1HZX0_CAEJA